jgi:hypothetical protein
VQTALNRPAIVTDFRHVKFSISYVSAKGVRSNDRLWPKSAGRGQAGFDPKRTQLAYFQTYDAPRISESTAPVLSQGYVTFSF